MYIPASELVLAPQETVELTRGCALFAPTLFASTPCATVTVPVTVIPASELVLTPQETVELSGFRG